MKKLLTSALAVVCISTPVLAEPFYFPKANDAYLAELNRSLPESMRSQIPTTYKLMDAYQVCIALHNRQSFNEIGGTMVQSHYYTIWGKEAGKYTGAVLVLSVNYFCPVFSGKLKTYLDEP